jgi:hypothetical protein
MGEVWFDEEPRQGRVDVITYRQRPEPLGGGGWTPFHTRIIDLRLSEAELRSNVRKQTRQEIRRAGEQDGTVCSHHDGRDEEAFAQLQRFFDHWAVAQGRPPCDQVWLKAMADAGRLDISTARSAKGTLLVCHAHYLGRDRARAVCSASLRREDTDPLTHQIVGRANRLLHWNDMICFRGKGITYYDFAGWYTGDTDPRLLTINQFKAAFGGEVVCDYNCRLPVSLKGKAALWLRSLPGQLASRQGAANEGAIG